MLNESQAVFLRRVHRYRRLRELGAPKFILERAQLLILTSTKELSIDDFVDAIFANSDFDPEFNNPEEPKSRRVVELNLDGPDDGEEHA